MLQCILGYEITIEIDFYVHKDSPRKSTLVLSNRSTSFDLVFPQIHKSYRWFNRLYMHFQLRMPQDTQRNIHIYRVKCARNANCIVRQTPISGTHTPHTHQMPNSLGAPRNKIGLITSLEYITHTHASHSCPNG